MFDIAQTGVVNLARLGDIAVITIDNPPINAGSTAVRKGLLQAVNEFAADDTLQGAILIGAGRWFMAGSDMREINAAVLDPPLPAIIGAIEACPKPVVAAIAGAALGGGYELSLGCDARLASPEAMLGLPECVLGMMPGAGGTQRLPRVAGLPVSISLICSGTRVAAPEAQALGMIDEVIEGDLLEAAVAHLRAMGGRKRRIMDLPVPACDPAELNAAKAAAIATAGDRPHIRCAIESVERCMTTPGDEALRIEREVFNRLRTGPEAKAMIHLFFAERNRAKLPAPEQRELQEGAWAQRLRDACRRACQVLLEQGISAGDIARSLEAFGLRADIYSWNQRGSIATADAAAPETLPPAIDFCLGAMANEAALLLTEGVAGDPLLIDLQLVERCGFPRHQGGVVFWARQQRCEDLNALLDSLHSIGGRRFTPAPVEPLVAPAGHA